MNTENNQTNEFIITYDCEKFYMANNVYNSLNFSKVPFNRD